MKKTLVIVFDFDGTIADTMEAIRKIMNQLANEFTFRRIKDKDLENLREMIPQEFLKTLGISLIKFAFISKRVRVELNKEIGNLKPHKGVKKTLINLRNKGYHLGILTSNLQENVEKFLKMNALSVFDFIYSGSSFLGKYRVLKRLLKEQKLKKEKVIYVGDELRDIEAAKKSGVRIIAVSWGFNTERLLRKGNPDYFVKKPQELINLLKNL